MTRIDLHTLLIDARRRDLERPLLQSLVPEHEAVAIPPDRLDPVASLVHEQK